MRPSKQLLVLKKHKYSLDRCSLDHSFMPSFNHSIIHSCHHSVIRSFIRAIIQSLDHYIKRLRTTTTVGFIRRLHVYHSSVHQATACILQQCASSDCMYIPVVCSKRLHVYYSSVHQATRYHNDNRVHQATPYHNDNRVHQATPYHNGNMVHPR